MAKLYPFMKDQNYIEIVKEYRDALLHLEKQYKYKTENTTVKESAKKKFKEILAQLEKFHADKKKYYNDREKTIKNSYKNHEPNYSNPEAEILKRQDFDLKLSIASDDDLLDMVEDTDLKLNEYRMNRLIKEFKDRNIQSMELSKRKLDEKINKKHEADPNYQKLEEEANCLWTIQPRGNDTTLLLPLEQDNVHSLNRLTSFPRPERLRNDIRALNKGIEIMEQQVMSTQEWQTRLIEPISEDIKKYIDDEVGKGRDFKVKEYDDLDLRAIRGSNTFDVVHEYKYLKERYHEPDNYLYSFDNPDYSVYEHIEFLRGKHQQYLKENPDFAEQIRKKLEQQEAAKEDTQIKTEQ